MDRPNIPGNGAKTPASVHRLVLASVIMTVMVPVSLAVLDATGIGQSLGLFRAETSDEYEREIFEKFFDPEVSEYSGSMRDRIDNYIRLTNPKQIVKFVAASQNSKQNYETSKYAVEIAEKSALRYKYPPLAFLAVSDLMIGKTGAVDFQRAMKILELPFVIQDNRHDLYMGLWWSDQKNPDVNYEIAKTYLDRASKNGFSAATNKLSAINKRNFY